MTTLFLTVFNLGIVATWLILAVMLLRPFLKKMPKWITCALWMIVGLRLICPLSIESPFSLIPKAALPALETVETGTAFETEAVTSDGVNTSPGTDSNMTAAAPDEIPNTDAGLNAAIPGKVPSTNFGADTTTIRSSGIKTVFTTLLPALSILWVMGVLAMLAYLIGSYLHLNKSLATATRLRDNVWESEYVKSPFILGILRPRIYIPYHLSEDSLSMVLAHENAHLKRRDHILKFGFFLILAIYWFHPLVWVSYSLLCKDIELACDEKVVLSMNSAERTRYSRALLECEIKNRALRACPLAFGEVGVKERVLRVKFYKKPAFWIVLTVLLAGLALVICFFTIPAGDSEKDISNTGNSNNAVVDGDNPEIDNSPGEEASPETDNRKDAPSDNITNLTPMVATPSEDTSTGADGASLYYADKEKLIYGGYFGLFVRDRETKQNIRSLDLEPIGCNFTQGDNYCEIRISADGNKIYLRPMADQILYTYSIEENTLTSQPSSVSIGDNPELTLYPLQENSKTATYMEGNAGQTIRIVEKGTFGSIAFMEYFVNPDLLELTTGDFDGYNTIFAYNGYQYRFLLDMNLDNLSLQVNPKEETLYTSPNTTLLAAPVLVMDGEKTLELGKIHGYSFLYPCENLVEPKMAEGNQFCGQIASYGKNELLIKEADAVDMDTYLDFRNIAEEETSYILAEDVEFIVLDIQFINTEVTYERFLEHLNRSPEKFYYFFEKDGKIIQIWEPYIP